MAQSVEPDLEHQFEDFYRSYYDEEIKELAGRYPGEQRSLYVDWQDCYRYSPDLADDVLERPRTARERAEGALELYDLPIDVSLSGAHVRFHNLPADQQPEIREIRAEHVNTLIKVRGIVRKATDVRPKIVDAAFECQVCGIVTHVPQTGGEFREPVECQGCERQGPFSVAFEQSTFVDAQKLRIQESPEGLRGGETPQALDVAIEDDLTGKVTPGDHVTVTGVLRMDQQGTEREQSRLFDFHMEGMTLEIEEEQFEEMDITDEERREILELSNREDIFELMGDSIAPALFGLEDEKLAIVLQLFSGVRKKLPDGSKIRGDIHLLLVGDPGTGKSQLLSYIRNIAPRAVYTSGKGSSSAGLTAAAIRDDFGDGQQWTLEAGALVLADQGVAAVDELDKMRCITGDSLVQLADGSVKPIGALAADAATSGDVEEIGNGRTIRDIDVRVLTMAEAGTLVERPVTAIHEYDSPGELVEVVTEHGQQLRTTADHPFFLHSDQGIVERPADELAVGDQTLVPRDGLAPLPDGGNVSQVPQSRPHYRDVEPVEIVDVHTIDENDSRVYDLTVEGTHNFIANGMVVHNSEDRSAMHEALEQQQISISKAGINATLQSRCSLLGAANPKHGRFDPYESMGEQIDLEPALISRFDLIFTVTDKPDEQRDRDLAEHILETNFAGELRTQREELAAPDIDPEAVQSATERVDPEIDPELLRKYVAYAKQHCHPRMEPEAREAIRDFYVNLRSRGTDADAPVPVTARKLEGLVRLAEASARVRLSDTVTLDDAERVIELVRACLREIGVDPETGQFDADIVEAGTTKTQRDRIRTIKGIISDLESNSERGAPLEDVLDRAEEVGLDEGKATHAIEKLKKQGELYEPATDHLRTT